MSGKSKFFDYEPLSQPKASRRGVPQAEDGFQRRPVSGLTSDKASSFERDNIDRETRHQQNVTGTSSFSGILKRGHALSFFGLFLFTTMLYVRPYETFPSLAWTKGITFWIALATIVAYVPTQLGVDGSLTIRPREVNLILLFFVCVMLSIPLASEVQTSWNSATDYIKVVLMFVVLVNVVRTELRLKLLILLVLLVTCGMSIAAINDYRLGNLASNGERIKGIIGGMFDNPNDLALHLVTIVPIAISLVLASRAGLKKLLYLASAFVLVAGVVVTFSRGGFLGLVCMGGTLFWRIARRNKWMILLAPLILVAFVVLAPGGYGKRLATTSDGSAVERTDDLKRSIFIAVRHPLFGVGMGNYVLYSNKEHASHNAYTQVASELGLTAFVIYVLFQIAAIKDLRRITRETAAKGPNSRYHYLAIGLEASLVGYMVSSFFASVAFLWYVYYLVGYAVCLRRLHAASELREPRLTETDPAKQTVVGKAPLITVG
jgi:putative inorganic carbon (HCO3(-)) transporter